MDDFDKRTRKAIDTMEGNLSDKATAQHSKIGANIKNLEKYVEEMHNQQIIDYEKLKKDQREKKAAQRAKLKEQDNERAMAIQREKEAVKRAKLREND